MLSDTLYLDNIEEYIQDESRIVTYKWLSRNLEVPANTAKQMLYSYVSRCQKSSSEQQINVTYLVTGITNNNKSHQVCIVEEGDLEDTKKNFSELLSIHIYSVQKNKLKETCSLYTADYDINQEYISEYSKWSPIECPVNIRKAGNVTNQQKTNFPVESIAKPSPPTLSHMNKPNPFKQDTALSPRLVKQEHCPKPTGKIGSSSKSKPASKGSMMSFFSSKNDKQKTSSAAAAKKTETKPNLQQELKKEPVIALNVPAPTAISPPKEEKSNTKIILQSKRRVFVGLNDSDIDDEDSEEEKPRTETKPLSRRGKQNTLTTKKTKPAKGAKPDKDGGGQKRRRVQELSSDEEVVEKEKKSSSTSAGGRRRKKVKKLVPKMHMSSDGSMVTERSWEMVSTDASDEEDNAAAMSKKPKVETERNLDKASPKKKKQATLTNFFK